jgi:stalled ribosome rescue protein Dom34
MISVDDVRSLQAYPHSDDSLVLSLYIDVDQTRASNLNRGFETAAENQLRKIAETEAANKNGRLARFDAERRQALRFLSEYTPRGKGLVIFSDVAKSFWWQRELQVELPTQARWSPQPWVRPLLEVLERHDPLAVALIDKHHARIFVVGASGIEHQSELVSDVPGKHHTTGTDHIWSQNHMDRDHLKHLKWHAKKVAEALGLTIDKAKATRLVVGGPVEATAMFTDELPKRLQQMIAGTVSVPVDIANDKLLGELAFVQGRAEHEDELKLVRSMITSARKGDRAVVGLVETLGACQQGRIHRLVVDSSYSMEGGECTVCRVLVPPGPGRCSFCGGEIDAAPDLINRLSHRVLEQNGKVSTVSEEAAQVLAEAGHIGAVLRF